MEKEKEFARYELFFNIERHDCCSHSPGVVFVPVAISNQYSRELGGSEWL